MGMLDDIMGRDFELDGGGPRGGGGGGGPRAGGVGPLGVSVNENVVPVRTRVPVAPPPGYRPGIDPEWNYFPMSNPPASVIDPMTVPAPVLPYGADLSLLQNLDFSNLDLSGLGSLGTPSITPPPVAPVVPSLTSPAMPPYTMPEIDYDLLASSINMPTFDIPDYTDLSTQLADIQGGLAGLQIPDYQTPTIDYEQLAANMPDFTMPSFEMPDFTVPTIDYEQLAANIPDFTMPTIDYDLLAGNMPSFDLPDYTQQFENLGTTLGGVESYLGNLGNINMPTFEMPDYTQQFENLQSGIGGLGSQIGGLQGNMPSFEMPDYTQQFENLGTTLGGLGQQIGGLQMPSFESPDYNQQFENLQQQIGNIGYGGPSLAEIQGLMPTYKAPDYSQELANIMGSLNTLQPQQYVPENPYGLGGVGFARGGPIRYGIGESVLRNKYLNPGVSDTGTAEWWNPVAALPHVTFENLEQTGEPMVGMPFGSYGKRINEELGWEPPPETLEEYEKRKKEELARLFAQNPENRPIPFAEGGPIRYQAGEGITGLTRELGGTGGQEAMMTEGNEQLIQATIQAVLGMLPDQQTADAVIQQFIGLYGQEAFMALREEILQSQAPGAQTEGLIEGFGGGMDDFVQGVAGSQETIAASPGEYIVPADVVSQLGDGNSTEGSRKLDGMSKRVRMAKTGTIEQAPPIDSRKVLPI